MYFSYTGTGGHEPWEGGHVASPMADPLPHKLYFAEGTTRDGFDEWICVFNPNQKTASLTFNYMVEGEGLKTVRESVSPKHRATFYVPDHVGKGKDVSLELVSDVPVAAERPMYFAYRSVNPARPGRVWAGGHVMVGARGATANEVGFAFAPVKFVPGMGWGDTWVCLQNPNPAPAPVTISVCTKEGLVAQERVLPPLQRTTIYYPHLLPGPSREPSCFWVRAKDASLPILVERPVYMEFEFREPSNPETISGGSVSFGQRAEDDIYAGRVVGRTYSAAKYAEGHTGDGFTMWMVCTTLDSNKTSSERTIVVYDCYLPGAEQLIPVYWEAREGERRWEACVWRVNNQFPHTDIAIAAANCSERVMAFSYGPGWTGMHTSTGVAFTCMGL
ncbi:MAG: hypothetical protein H5T74_02970 [Actinobacteria bacterium]|nr:hypothetical protein [Actinomycetota bacterium]